MGGKFLCAYNRAEWLMTLGEKGGLNTVDESLEHGPEEN